MEGGPDKYQVLLAFNFSFLSLTCSSGLLGTWDGGPDGACSPLGINSPAWVRAVSCSLAFSVPTPGKRVGPQTRVTRLRWELACSQTICGSSLLSGCGSHVSPTPWDPVPCSPTSQAHGTISCQAPGLSLSPSTASSLLPLGLWAQGLSWRGLLWG